MSGGNSDDDDDDDDDDDEEHDDDEEEEEHDDSSWWWWWQQLGAEWSMNVVDSHCELKDLFSISKKHQKTKLKRERSS